MVSYWNDASTDLGRTKGPIHLVVKIITECCSHGSPTQWTVPRHGNLGILRGEDAIAIFRDMAVQSVWKDLSRDRQGYQGLAQGIDYPLTLSFPRTLKGEHFHRMRAILQDGVGRQLGRPGLMQGWIYVYSVAKEMPMSTTYGGTVKLYLGNSTLTA